MMKKTTAIIGWTLGTILLFLVICISAGCYIMFHVIPNSDIRPTVENAINDRLNAKATFSKIGFTLIPSFPDVSMYIDNFCIRDSTTNDTLAAADRVSVSLNAKDLIQNRLSVKEIKLSSPFAHFSIDSTGTSNFHGLFKPVPEKTDTVSNIPDEMNFNSISLNDAAVRYDNSKTGEHLDVNGIGISVQGKINTADSTLEIRYGKLKAYGNMAEFRGSVTTDNVKFELSYDLENLNGLIAAAALRTDAGIMKKLEESDLEGKSRGKWSIAGPLNDSLQGITIKGTLNAKNLAFTSPKKKELIKSGELALGLRYMTGVPDSTYLHIDSLRVSGPEIALDMRGSLTVRKEKGFWVDAAVKSDINMDMIKLSGILPDGITLEGKIKTDFRTSSSLHDLLHGYRLPKSVSALKNLDIRVRFPDIAGRMKIYGLKLMTDTLTMRADTLDLALEGKKSRIGVIADDITIDHDGAGENVLLKLHKGDIGIDGRNMTARIDIDRAGFLDITGTDTVSLSAETVDMNIAARGKEFAICTVDKLTYSKGETNLLGARVNARLTNESPNGKTLWDSGSIGAFIVHYNGNNADTYCRNIKGSFGFTDVIKDIAVSSDSMSISVQENDIVAENVMMNADKIGQYLLKVGTAQARKTQYGIGLTVSSLDAGYNDNDKHLTIKAGHALLGHSDITADVSILFVKGKPVIDAALKGKFLDIDELVYAFNVSNLAKGDPAAVPLDSIPENALPRGIGREHKNIHLRVDMQKMKLSNLNLPEVTGEFRLKGYTTCIHNLQSPGIRLNTQLVYTDKDHSVSNVILEFNGFDVTRLSSVMPGFSKISPMLSALKGTLDLKLAISNPVRHILSINLEKARIAGTLQARDLSISDNEQFRKVAKTLMFKNKESTHIDSLAVAAKIDGGKVSILPFMLKVDRYKVALSGASSISTGAVDYHISILKSPVPFKFGLNVTGADPDYKMKIVKTEHKKLDPSVKPWTDPEFSAFRDMLEKPVKESASLF